MSYDKYVSLSRRITHSTVRATRRVRRVGAASWALGSAVAALAVAVILDGILIGVPLAGVFLVLSSFL